jgi:hypothetical protein
MNLLREKNLIFGSLYTVNEPHMIERYNRALEGFGLPPTKLEEFQIDMTGFSPEIAEELDDMQYLDPAGINRRFIILTPSQSELPVVHTFFSNTEDLMVDFFNLNARALYALTIKDVVFGEIEDSVFKVEDIEELLAIEQVEFKLSTPTKLLAKSARLKTMMERLRKEPDAWRNDKLLNDMVETVKVTGDIRTNTLLPDEVIFRHDTYWTAHFGGIYVFIDEEMTTVIGHPSAPGFRRSRPWQVSYLDIDDKSSIFGFLVDSGRIELPRGSWIERTGLLDKRAQMVAIWLARELEPELDFNQADQRWTKSWIARNAGLVENEGSIPLIAWASAKLSDWSELDMNEINPLHRFVLCRAMPEHKDRFLINRLISEYLPFDYMMRYIYNKPAFYKEYEKWPESFREFAVEEISRDYLSDRAGYRQRYYH